MAKIIKLSIEEQLHNLYSEKVFKDYIRKARWRDRRIINGITFKYTIIYLILSYLVGVALTLDVDPTHWLLLHKNILGYRLIYIVFTVVMIIVIRSYAIELVSYKIITDNKRFEKDAIKHFAEKYFDEGWTARSFHLDVEEAHEWTKKKNRFELSWSNNIKVFTITN